MDATVLDTLTEANAQCYLCKISLKEYIENLPVDYQDYEVQREIVTNIYLDDLITTVLNKRHIPPIVLIGEKITKKENGISINSFKILDGLQRTYRLNSIWKTILLFEEELMKDDSITTLSPFSISRQYGEALNRIESSSKILTKIIEFYNSHCHEKGFKTVNSFNNNNQWFEIWTNLTEEQEVEKMLVLNAGHKPVKIKHQLELIFRNLLPTFANNQKNGFEVIREKQISSIQFSKKRTKGQFHFSHLIASLLSFINGAVVTTNSSLIQKLQNEEIDTDNDSVYFNYKFIKNFIDTLLFADDKMSEIYQEDGLRWFGREVALVGIFGALGKYVEVKGISPQSGLVELRNKLADNIKLLNLRNFENVRNQQDLGKINIGAINKNAVYLAFSDLLNANLVKKIDWDTYFKAR